MNAFLTEYWRQDVDADLALRFWEAVNAVDSNYEGIKPKDFFECHNSWDLKAIN